MGGGGGEVFQTTTTQGNLEEKLEPNLDEVIDNIQFEHVELVVPFIESKYL
jgi:hypothetical protein